MTISPLFDQSSAMLELQSLREPARRRLEPARGDECVRAKLRALACKQRRRLKPRVPAGPLAMPPAARQAGAVLGMCVTGRRAWWRRRAGAEADGRRRHCVRLGKMGVDAVLDTGSARAQAAWVEKFAMVRERGKGLEQERMGGLGVATEKAERGDGEGVCEREGGSCVKVAFLASLFVASCVMKDSRVSGSYSSKPLCSSSPLGPPPKRPLPSP